MPFEKLRHGQILQIVFTFGKNVLQERVVAYEIFLLECLDGIDVFVEVRDERNPSQYINSFQMFLSPSGKTNGACPPKVD